MIEFSRELVAYAIIAAIVVIGVPWLGFMLRRRHRTRLRRQGIKRHGH